MRKSVYECNLASEFGNLKLKEFTQARLLARCEKIKACGAAAQAVHAKESVLQVLHFVEARESRPTIRLRP